jgi:SAM-dependent methyltransferase
LRFVKQNIKNTDYPGRSELFLSEKYLEVHNLTIVRYISRYLSNKRKILEFGAGIGTLAILYRNLNKIRPDCIEIDKVSQKILANRKFKVFSSLDLLAGKYDGIYSSNVLEHISDDMEILKKISTSLKKNGILVLYLPAFMFLYSDMDKAVGHYRRYEKNEIIRKLQRSNFKIINYYFVDSIGYFALLAVKIFGYKNKKNVSKAFNIPLGHEKHIKFYGRFVSPVSNFFDSLGLRFFFGKNIFIVAKKSI